MHAVLASGECSRRALEVATAVIGQNSADYSAWALRWACAQAAVAGAAPDGASSPLLDELRFTEELAEESPKNYQLWNHRRLVAGALAQQSAALSAAVGEREDAFTAAVLEGDAKNYHAWAHRAWLAHTFADQPGRDLAFTRSHLELDDRNNSAWNGRFTTLGLMHGHSHWPPGVAAEELQLAHACLDADPGNESAWAYAVAVARAGDVPDALHGARGTRIDPWADDASGPLYMLCADPHAPCPPARHCARGAGRALGLQLCRGRAGGRGRGGCRCRRRKGRPAGGGGCSTDGQAAIRPVRGG